MAPYLLSRIAVGVRFARQPQEIKYMYLDKYCISGNIDLIKGLVL